MLVRINWNRCPASCMLCPYLHKTDYFQQYDWTRLLPMVCSMLQRLISDNGWLFWHYPECENGETKLAYNIFGWDVCCALATQNAGWLWHTLNWTVFWSLWWNQLIYFLSPECKRMYFTSTGAHLRWCLRCCYRTAYFLLPCYCMHKENVCEGDLHSCLTHLSETELTAHVHV